MPTPDGVGELENILSQLWPASYQIQTTSGVGRRPPGITFGLLPHPRRPTLLIPNAPRLVTACAIRGYKSPSSLADRLRARSLGWAASAGAGYLFPWTVTVARRSRDTSLLGHIEEHADESLHTAIAIGPPRANRKPVLQLITPRGSRVGFVKVGVNSLTRHRVLAEARALDRLGRLVMPGLKVPEVLDIPPWRDTPFLATRPLNTWTSRSISTDGRRRALRSLVTAAEVTNTELRTSLWWCDLTDRIAALGTSSEAVRLREARHRIESQIGHLTITQGQTHGDWSPWNIATQGTQVTAWDWERFTPQAPVGYDALHYAVQEEIRLRAKPPREALFAVRNRAPMLVTQNGADPDHGTALFALYLLAQGEQHLTDGQLEAGSERGSISDWLLPALETTIAQLSGITL